MRGAEKQSRYHPVVEGEGSVRVAWSAVQEMAIEESRETDDYMICSGVTELGLSKWKKTGVICEVVLHLSRNKAL